MTLLTISRIIAGATDSTEALRQTCKELARFTGAETVSLHLLDSQLRMLVPSAAYHVPKEMLPTLMASTLPVDEQGFRDSVFGLGEVAWSDDVQHDPRFEHGLFRVFPHRSGAVVPVVLDGEVAGAFYLVWWQEAHRFDDAQLQTLQGIGRQVALLLRVNRLLRETQEHRREAEAANERYRSLFDLNLAGVLWTRPDGTIVDCNGALSRVLGHESREALIGSNVTDLYVDRRDRDAVLAAVRRDGVVTSRELAWRRRDGTLAWLHVSARRRDDGIFEAVLIDISDRKRAEEAERQATALRATASLANAASHEINNPLSVIVGHLTMLARERGLDARIAPMLEAVTRIREIVSRMGQITRVEAAEHSSNLPGMLDIRKSSDEPR